jgi:inorganic pyrophosphatase
MGGVYRVKPLGVYAMIDDGELDWKVRGGTDVGVLWSWIAGA